MASPCPKCGGTKTDPVSHGLMYNLAWAFGYRLQQCSRCRTSRYMPRHRGGSSHPSQLGKERVSPLGLAEEERALGSAEARPGPNRDQATAPGPMKCELPRCPACGRTKSHRTQRTTMERMLRRPPMLRCESCGMRFPHPGLRAEYFEPLKLLEVGETVPCAAEVRKTPEKAEEKTQPEVPKQAATAPRIVEEKKTPRTSEEKTQPEILKQGAAVSRFAEEERAPTMAGDSAQPEFAKRVNAAASPDGDLRSCPACGSTKSHRTRRTTMERLLQRPPMARCEGCGMRFPYFERHDRSPDLVKSGEAAASASHVGEEGRGARRTEESSQPNVDKQGTAAASSKRGLNRCPFCGSTGYQRSRRSTLEHLLLRPKMARCRNCRKRFPYLKR